MRQDALGHVAVHQHGIEEHRPRVLLVVGRFLVVRAVIVQQRGTHAAKERPGDHADGGDAVVGLRHRVPFAPQQPGDHLTRGTYVICACERERKREGVGR